MKITEGTRVRYSGQAWNPKTLSDQSVDGEFIALDGVDMTERGTYLVVVPPEHYPPVDESHDLLICDHHIESIEIV